MNSISDDDIHTVTWMKSARVGYTKCICAAVGYFAEHKRRNQLFYQPTNTDAQDFVLTEIDTMIRDVPVVREALRSDIDKKSKDNTRARKVFYGSVLDIKGGNSPGNYRRMTKSVVFYDELDGFDRSVGGTTGGGREGSPTALGDKRLEGSPFPKSVRGSTPKIKNESLIESSLAEADMVFRRYLPCPECGEYQVLHFSNLRMVDKDPNTAKFVCVSCNYHISYKEYPAMDSHGQWRTEDGIYIDDDDFFRDEDGDIVNKPHHVGFFIWAAYSYLTTWTQICREFLEADEALKRGDDTKLHTITNTLFGETWEENKGDQIEWAELKGRAEPYEVGIIPRKGLMLVAGVDVQDNRLAVVIVAYGENEESYRIYWQEIYGDPIQSYVWEQLDELLNRDWKHDSGAYMRISCCAVDSGGHKTQAVYNYCRKRTPQVMAVKGASNPGKPVISKPSMVDVSWDGKLIPNGAQVWMVGTDTAKKILIPRMKITEPGPGYFHTPIGMTDDYYQQVTAEKYITKISKGVPYSVFEPTGRNEAIDCEVYAYAAAQRLGLSRKDAKYWNKQKQLIQDYETLMANKNQLAALGGPVDTPNLIHNDQKKAPKRKKIVKSKFMS